MKSTYKYVRNHIITGFIFLMPVLISIVVVSKFWNKLLIAGNKVSKLIRVDTLLSLRRIIDAALNTVQIGFAGRAQRLW